LLKRLENDLGLRLLARTTRSVAPTEAGARLLTKLAPALDEVATEVELLTNQRDRPIGKVRVSSGKHAVDAVLWPRLAPLMHRHPGIEVEICVDNSYVDIVAGHFDAGIRMGERLEKDMVAVAIGPSLRVAVVASPDYLSEHGAPREPADLSRHRCISFRTPRGELAAWDFERDGQKLTVTPGNGPIFNDGDLMVSAALEGFGILYILEDLISGHVADGSLTQILDDWCAPFAGYYLYYPSRRQKTAAFSLFVDALRQPNGAQTGAEGSLHD
jgi:DNA-binding transcriptional LysR family regulator